jgi:hypothetical protein
MGQAAWDGGNGRWGDERRKEEDAEATTQRESGTGRSKRARMKGWELGLGLGFRFSLCFVYVVGLVPAGMRCIWPFVAFLYANAPVRLTCFLYAI